MHPLPISTDQLPAVGCRLSISLTDNEHNKKLRQAVVGVFNGVLSELNAAAQRLPKTSRRPTTREETFITKVELPLGREVTVLFTLAVSTSHRTDAQSGQFVEHYANTLKRRLRIALRTAAEDRRQSGPA